MRDRIFSHYLRELVAICSLPRPASTKRRLIILYSKLFLRYVLAVKFSYKRSAAVRIGRSSVTPADFGSFRFLFEEVFIRRIYDVVLGSEKPTIVDCGANIGMSLAFFKEEFPQSEIRAFEPDPENFRCLQSTIHASFPDATAYNVALGAEPGRLPLYYTSGSGGSISKSLFKELLTTTEVASEFVEVVRLSDYLKSTVDLLKIDVEGAETGIMRDLISTNAIRFVKNMIIEFHEINRKDDRSFADFLATLQRKGFFFTLSAEPHQNGRHMDITSEQTILVYATRGPENVPLQR